MSILSKVFVILVFVAALVKLGIDVTLFAQRADWKHKFLEEVRHHYQTQQIKNAEIAARDLEIENQRTFVTILNEKINTMEVENAAKATRISDLQKAVDSANIEKTKLLADLDVFVRQLDVQLAQINDMTLKLEEYRGRLAKSLAEKSTAVSQLQYERQMAERLQQDLAELENKHVQMAREKKLLEERIAHLNQMGIRTEVAPKQALQGKVMAVSPEIGLVVISIGKDAGVKEGDEFTVYRGGDFVAKIVIDRADRNYAGGRIVLKKMDPRVADDVSNQIMVSAPKPGAGQ